MEYAACCIWKCRLWPHLRFLPLPFRQKQSVQPIVCILPTTGNQYQPIHFHLPMPLWALAALSDKGKRKKKNLIDNGLSSTLFSLGAASIRCEDIFFPLRLSQARYYGCSFERASGGLAHMIESISIKGGLHFKQLILGRCTIIANMLTVHAVSYLKETLMLIGCRVQI